MLGAGAQYPNPVGVCGLLNICQAEGCRKRITEHDVVEGVAAKVCAGEFSDDVGVGVKLVEGAGVLMELPFAMCDGLEPCTQRLDETAVRGVGDHERVLQGGLPEQPVGS